MFSAKRSHLRAARSAIPSSRCLADIALRSVITLMGKRSSSLGSDQLSIIELHYALAVRKRPIVNRLHRDIAITTALIR